MLPQATGRAVRAAINGHSYSHSRCDMAAVFRLTRWDIDASSSATKLWLNMRIWNQLRVAHHWAFGPFALACLQLNARVLREIVAIFYGLTPCVLK